MYSSPEVLRVLLSPLEGATPANMLGFHGLHLNQMNENLEERAKLTAIISSRDDSYTC